MNFLNIGLPELFLVLVLAFIVLGPEKLNRTLYDFARMLRKLFRSEQWQTASSIYRDIRQYPAKIMKEAQLEDIQKELDAYNRQIETELRQIKDGMKPDALLQPEDPTSETGEALECPHDPGDLTE